jgi:hypothetical protein
LQTVADTHACSHSHSYAGTFAEPIADDPLHLVSKSKFVNAC